MQAVTLPQALGDLVLGIDHITVAVRDLDKAIRWYCEVLGFKLTDRRGTRGERTSMESAVVSCGQAVVVLVQGNEPDSQVSRFIEHCGEGVSHVAFAVTELDEAIRRVEAVRGKLDIPVVESEGIRQVFLHKDPETGVRIELIERRGGRFNDEAVRQLFRVLEERDLY